MLDHPSHDAAREWVQLLRACLPPGAPMRRVPASVTDDRLIGGVDLAATLATGRLVVEPGVLAASDGGVVVLPMAERASDVQWWRRWWKCSTCTRCVWSAKASPRGTTPAWCWCATTRAR